MKAWVTGFLVFTIVLSSLVGITTSLMPAKFQSTQRWPGAPERRFIEYEEPDSIIENRDEKQNETVLRKRGEMRIIGRTADEEADLNQGYQDMLTLINYINSNFDSIDAAIFDVYFDPSQRAKVKAVASTIIAMSQSGGITNMARSMRQYRPADLNDIALLRDHGTPPTLAQAINTGTAVFDPAIYIYDFGWQVLYRRLLSEYTCAMLDQKVNYKMQFLGGLIFHEVL